MNRFGNVRELPSGRYQARRRPRTGPQIKAPHTFETEQEAQEWLSALEEQENTENGR